uniref:CSC1-like protein ERD4 n=1 Tax=Clytia hemisphaerica TaxID=252671 RepID=A0A7M5V1M3_9CNID
MSLNGTAQNGTLAEDLVEKPSEKIKSVLVMCVFIFVFAVIFFTFTRKKNRKVFAPRLLLLGTESSIKEGLFSWVTDAFSTKDEDIFMLAGMDALVFLRFMRLMLKFAVCSLPYGICVLIPLNVHGGNGLDDGLEKMSMSNVEEKSAYLWAHWVAVYLYSILILVFCLQEWKVYISFRQRHLKNATSSDFAVLVKELPKNMTDDDTLYEFVNELFPNEVASVYVIRDLGKYKTLVEKHDLTVLQWEDSKFFDDSNDEKKMMTKGCCCFGEKVEATQEYEKQLEILQGDMKTEKTEGNRNPMNCAFVVFKSIKAKELALKSTWTNNPIDYQPCAAPTVKETLWCALKLNYYVRLILEAIGYILIFFLVIFWAIPITFIASLGKLNSIAREVPWLADILRALSVGFVNFAEGLLPVILIAVFFAILPLILFLIARLQGNYSSKICAELVFKYMFIFQTVNSFFIYVLSGALIEQITAIAQDPFQIPNLLAKSIPSQSGFYINYVAFATAIGYFLTLTRIVPMIVIWLKLKCLAKTPRQRLEAWKPPRAVYELLFSKSLLFFLVGLSYSVLSPIIVPFVIIFFGFGYVVYLYQLTHVYMPEFDHGGRFWIYVFNRIMVIVFVFQLLMVGVFLLKEVFTIAILVTPLIICTIFFWIYVNNNFEKVSLFITLKESVGMQHADPALLEDLKNSYILDHSVPEIFAVSTDKAQTEEESMNDETSRLL